MVSRQKMFFGYVPNTYEFYWNTTSEKFRDKMIKEYRNFWNKSVLQKQTTGLTQLKQQRIHEKKKMKDQELLEYI
jgi:hypothetical protein